MASLLSATLADNLGIRWLTFLQLGRVSNLPTVWTNVIAAVFIAQSPSLAFSSLLLVITMSAAYTAGMYLNDAFDHQHDAQHRPNRPIPAGQITHQQVHAIGLGILLFAVVLTYTTRSPQASSAAVLSAVVTLALIILVYNLWHKNNPLSPILMGLCRAMVYVTCVVSVSHSPPALLVLALMIHFCYIIGLTYSAKQEDNQALMTSWPYLFLFAPVLVGLIFAIKYPLIGMFSICIALWTTHCLKLIRRRHYGDIPTAVARLIAGVSLVDALIVAIAMTEYGFSNTGAVLCVVCAIAFFATMQLQRVVQGT